MIAEDVVTYLKAQGTVSVGGRIYQGYAGQKVSRPYIVVNLLRDKKSINSGGSDSDFREAQLWIHIHHKTQVMAGAVVAAIETLWINGFRGNMGDSFVKAGTIDDLRELTARKQDGTQDVDPGYSMLVTLIYGVQA